MIEQREEGFQPKGPMAAAPPYGTKSFGNWGQTVLPAGDPQGQ